MIPHPDYLDKNTHVHEHCDGRGKVVVQPIVLFNLVHVMWLTCGIIWNEKEFLICYGKNIFLSIIDVVES